MSVYIKNKTFNVGFASHQKVLKTFPGPGYLGSEDEVVYIYIYI